MKKNKILSKIIAVFLGLSLFIGLSACSNELGENVPAEKYARASAVTLNPTVELKICVLGIPSEILSEKGKPGVWAWAKAGPDTNYTSATWPGDLAMKKGTESGYDCYTYTLKVDPNYDLGILFNNIAGNDGKPQTKDIVITKENFQTATSFYFNWNSMAYYKEIDDCVGVFSASITSIDKSAKTAKLKLVTSLINSIAKEEITVKDSKGNKLSLKISGESISISNDSAEFEITDDSSSGASVLNFPYKVIYKTKELPAGIDMKLIDELYGNTANSVEGLGLTLAGSTATFKTWAPTAKSVNVLLYADSDAAYDSSKTKGYDAPGETTKDWGTAPTGSAVVKMTMDSATGVWSVENVDVSSYKYYKYQITVEDEIYYVSDIWHTVAGPDSVASQIVSIDDASTKPAGWESAYTNPFNGTSYNDAVIYEMHIRDWSRAYSKDSTGKFKDITNALGSNGSGEFAKHLKDLGITHVQILPMFDYAQINSNKNYNWGYNPYHYNVPEGRYVTDDYTDGTQAVLEAREMIKAFHDAGIAVIMDVVYNHTNGTLSGSLYDSTVPGYFYRQKADGTYSDGSGCGNETASERAMVQKYMIDSLKHWVNDYHINGFRFDLMGVHGKDTMKAIYDELYKIDNSILVYGEPWTGGTSALDSSKSATSAGTGTSGNGYGAFDDDFRDALKGAEFGGFNRGQIQGNYEDANLILGLSGKTIAKNKRNDTGKTGLALHYVECHDNYTLFDKLVYSMDSTISGNGDWAVKFENLYNSVMEDESKVNLIKKENKLAAAYVFLSQGTPFINGGQEFMRTKKGSPDSYSADIKGGITWTNTGGKYNIDDVNTIDLSLKEKYSDVYNTYKGLIHLRKDYDAFRKPSNATAKTLKSGVTLYEVNGSNGNFAVVFNATNNDESFDKIEGNLVTVDTKLSLAGSYFGLILDDVDVDVEPYVVSSQKAQFSSVPAKSFIIIKK